MRRFAILIAVATSTLAPAGAVAQDELSPRFWAVTGVSAGDVLHLRDVPSAESRSLAGIPANAHGLTNLGCRRNQLPLEQWMRMSKTQRELAQTRWCRVEYRGKQGWVAGRFLKNDESAAR
jgi:hypothetical protein